MGSIKQILCSPLWFNNNLIRGQNLYINNWFKKGIKQISDLLDINGNFYQFDVLKEMYGINGAFLDYQSLIHKIPNYWKNMIINNVTNLVFNLIQVNSGMRSLQVNL